MSLIRDLENAQIKYREVRQKQMEAQLAQNLETERKGERFTLVEPPVPPEEPSSPNRRMILILGAVLALLAAAGCAFIKEAVDRSVRDRSDLTRLLTVPPLAIVPWIETQAERALRVRRRWYAMAGSVSIFIFMLVSAHFLYRPLDVLWAVAMRRLGI
jgi:polysaccharide biosynthesis transport protein